MADVKDPRARQVSGTSTMSAEAIPDEKNESVELLYDRLQAYKHACGYLEEYVEATEKFHRAATKEYTHVQKTIADPLKEGYHFDQSLGGVAGLFENLRTNTAALLQSHADAEKSLKGHVLPILTKLHAEIKSKAKEVESGAAKSAKSVEKARITTQKHIELLGQHTAALGSAGHRLEPKDDPYLLQRQIYHRLNKQVLEENSHTQELLALQNNFASFEAHVIQVFQNAFDAFHNVVSAQSEKQKALYGDILGASQRLPKDFEWNAFVRRYDKVLQNPNAPPRDVNSITFPNQNSQATQPLIEGTLDRKGKIMKSYDTGYYVITPAMYLHEFKDKDNIKKDPIPENSLYLPDCTVGALNTVEFKFNVKGKDLNKNKIGLNLSSNREYQFRAHNANDAEKWFAILSSCAGAGSTSSTGSMLAGGAAAGGSTVASPVEGTTAAGEHPPAYAERPHVNTAAPAAGAAPVAAEGITQSPAVAHSAGTGSVPQSATSAVAPQSALSNTTPTSAVAPGAGNAGTVPAAGTVHPATTGTTAAGAPAAAGAPVTTTTNAAPLAGSAGAATGTEAPLEKVPERHLA